MAYGDSTYKPNGALANWAYNPTEMTVDQLSKMAGPMQGATTYQPSQNALVSSQLTKLLKQDSPWLTAARTRAAQFSAGRGTLNSSMAAGAGELAAIEAGRPVAEGDATAYLTAERDNAAAANQFARDSNMFGREGALAIARAGFEAGGREREYEFKAGESAAERALEGDKLAADTAYRTADIDLRGKTLAADTDYRTKDIDLRGKTLEADTAYRKDDVALRRDTLAADTDYRGKDLALRDKTLASDVELKNKDIALKGEDLALRRDQTAADTASNRANALNDLQRSYMDARIRLETTETLDAEGKATAINAMADWYNRTALPQLREAYGNPEDWPDAIADAGTPAPSPAPSPRPTMDDYEWRDIGDGPTWVRRGTTEPY